MAWLMGIALGVTPLGRVGRGMAAPAFITELFWYLWCHGPSDLFWLSTSLCTALLAKRSSGRILGRSTPTPCPGPLPSPSTLALHQPWRRDINYNPTHPLAHLRRKVTRRPTPPAEPAGLPPVGRGPRPPKASPRPPKVSPRDPSGSEHGTEGGKFAPFGRLM